MSTPVHTKYRCSLVIVDAIIKPLTTFHVAAEKT